MLKTTYCVLVVLVLAALGVLTWRINQTDKLSVVVEEKKAGERPEIKFDLNEDETKMLVESGIAQTVVFLYRKSSFRESLRKEFPPEPAGYQFSILARRGGRGDLAIGIRRPEVSDITTYMGVNDYLKLPPEQLRVVGEILRDREEKK